MLKTLWKFLKRALLLVIAAIACWLFYIYVIAGRPLRAYGPDLPSQVMRLHARSLCGQGQGLLLHGPVYRVWEFGDMSTDEVMVQASQLDRQGRLENSYSYYTDEEDIELTEVNWYTNTDTTSLLHDETGKLLRKAVRTSRHAVSIEVPTLRETLVVEYSPLWQRLDRYSGGEKLTGSSWFNPSGSRSKAVSFRVNVDYVLFLKQGEHGFPDTTYFASYVKGRLPFWKRWFSKTPAAEKPILSNRFEYDIDDHGNWVTCRSIPHNVDGSVQPGKQTVVKRIIQYYQ